MRTHRSAAVVAALMALVAIDWLRWHAALPEVADHATPVAPMIHVTTPPSDSALAEAEDYIVSNDPFRLANAPSRVRFDPSNENGGAPLGVPPTPMLRPNMTLKAIVGGPPWQAIVDGIPGQPAGTVVRAGGTFDKLVARAVTRDSVIIQGPDTSWVLTFRRAP